MLSDVEFRCLLRVENALRFILKVRFCIYSAQRRIRSNVLLTPSQFLPGQGEWASAFPDLYIGGQSCQFSDTFDPCASGNHEPFPYMSDRCPDCAYSSNDRSDLYDLDHDTWYITEFTMTTRYVSPYSCGTRVPIWMNGTIPMIGECVVSRTACVATFESLCEKSYSIKVKRCDPENTVYCLDNLPSSIQQRYCFDFDPDIFTTKSSTKSSTTAAAKLPSTGPPRMGGEPMRMPMPIYKETGTQSWVIAVIAVLSIAIVALVAIIVVIFRQFRRNHGKHRTFSKPELPPSYKEATGFTPIEKKTEVITVVNMKAKY